MVFIINYDSCITSDMENKRYLLKAPNHLLHIEAILDVFPDANFIFTHRKLSQIVPSFFSLILAVNEQFGGTPTEKWKKRSEFNYYCYFIV